MESYPSKTKSRQCSRSLISSEPVCYICGTRENLEMHHIFGGRLRGLSERYGLTVCLCHEHHRGRKGAHGNGNVSLFFMRLAEAAFTEYYSHQLFIALFGDDMPQGSRGGNMTRDDLNTEMEDLLLSIAHMYDIYDDSESRDNALIMLHDIRERTDRLIGFLEKDY